MAKGALITGITGQDGLYLAKFLLDKGYKVFGTYRRLSTPDFWDLDFLNIFDKVNLIPADLVDSSQQLRQPKYLNLLNYITSPLPAIEQHIKNAL